MDEDERRRTPDTLLMTDVSRDPRTAPRSLVRARTLLTRTFQGRLFQGPAFQRHPALPGQGVLFAETAAPAAIAGGAWTLPTAGADRPAADILAEWRAVERRAAAVPPGSPEEAETRDLAERLRLEYLRAFERTRAGSRPTAR